MWWRQLADRSFVAGVFLCKEGFQALGFIHATISIQIDSMATYSLDLDTQYIKFIGHILSIPLN
jgi:hypothetical protein